MKNSFVFGVYQILGGLWGLVILANKILSTNLNLNQATISTIFVALFCLVILSGVLTIKRNTYAKRVSIVLLILRTIQFHISSIGFAFVAGGHIGFEMTEELSFFFRPLYGFFSISFENTDPDFINVNIVPFILLFLADRIFKE